MVTDMALIQETFKKSLLIFNLKIGFIKKYFKLWKAHTSFLMIVEMAELLRTRRMPLI